MVKRGIGKKKDWETAQFTEKWCIKCGDYRPRDQFYAGAGVVRGVTVHCIDCAEKRIAKRKERAAAHEKTVDRVMKKKGRDSKRYLADRENRLAMAKKWQEENPELRMMGFAMRRAKMYSVPFNLSVEDVVIPQFCPVFGFPLVRNSGIGAKSKPNSPTLDRINPELGYVRGNVQVISQKANSWKQSKTLDDLKLFAKWILTIKE